MSKENMRNIHFTITDLCNKNLFHFSFTDKVRCVQEFTATQSLWVMYFFQYLIAESVGIGYY